MAVTPQQLQEQANRQEEQRKYMELSEKQTKLYRDALKVTMPNNLLADWKYEEYDLDEKEKERERQLRGPSMSREATEEPSKVKDGIHTRDGATKSVIYRDGKSSPHGNEWTKGFDENGWREVFRFNKQQLGSDTFTFEFNNIGESAKVFGIEMDPTRKLAIKQLEGVIKLAKEEGVALNLGPHARKLVRELAEDDDYKGKFKDKEGNVVHYEHKIDEMLQDLSNNRDYQNLKMQLGDAKLNDFNNKVEPVFDKDKYIKGVYQKPGSNDLETDWKLKAEAAEKAVKALEDRLKDNDDVITRFDETADKQRKLIEQSADKAVLDKIKEEMGSGKKARLERDNAVDKVGKRNDNDLKSAEALKEKIKADITAIKAEVGDRQPNEKQKEALDKNQKLLESLGKPGQSGPLQDKITAQNNKLHNGIKAWEKKDGGRDQVIKTQKDKVDSRVSARPNPA